MTYFIGIDPGTKCGWAVLDEDGSKVASGVFDLSSKRHEGGGMRYVRARTAFLELHMAYGGAIWAYEEVRRHRGTSAAHVYGGIVSQLTALLEERGRPYTAIPVGTIKKTATGKGNASKQAMMNAAERKWGTGNANWSTLESDDEADALWCAECLRVDTLPGLEELGDVMAEVQAGRAGL
jgi:Holliday junction resolvasome RuvABC endonuclease subunit